MSDPGRLFEAARERRLFRYLVLYVGAAWAIAQVVEFFLDNYGWSHRVLDATLFLLAVGFFVVLVIAWYHGERGHQRVQRTEAFVLAALGVTGLVGTAWFVTRDAAPGEGETAAVDLGPNSVAVLPFRNEVAAPEFAWLDRGVAELLATDLSQLDTLRVVSGQRIFDLLRQLGVGEDEPVPEGLRTRITRRAGARFLLTGSIIGGPGNVQLVAELSDTRSGVTRASARARGADIFALIDQVSDELSADLLGRRLGPGESAPVTRLTTRSLEAFREYELGRTARFRFHLQDAREHFERAVALDSTFALAHFQLAGLLFQQGDVGTAVGHMRAADRHLDVASERDRLYVGGFVDMLAGRRDEGLRKLRELVAKYPDEKDARVILASFLQQLGASEAERHRLIRETVELDPFYAPGWNLLAYEAARAGDFAAADTLIERYVALEPGEANPLDSRGEIAELGGRYEDARASYRAALALRADFFVSLQHLVRTYLREGRPADARRELADYRAAEAADTRVWAWWLTADTRAAEGDIAGAVATYDSTVAVAASTGRSDLHGLALDQMVRTLIVLERYAEAADLADSLRRVRGRDGVTTAARLHALGVERRFGDLEALAQEAASYLRETPGFQTFARQAEAGMGMIVDYYRGSYDRVVAAFVELRRPGFPVVQFGYPGIRAALRTGDVETARAATEDLVSATGLSAPARLPPLETRVRDYFRARVAEMAGDTAAALQGYERLRDDWGDGLALVPLFRDIPSRLEALRGPPN